MSENAEKQNIIGGKGTPQEPYTYNTEAQGINFIQPSALFKAVAQREADSVRRGTSIILEIIRGEPFQIKYDSGSKNDFPEIIAEPLNTDGSKTTINRATLSAMSKAISIFAVEIYKNQNK